jgi:hypothetical protein
MVNPASGNTYAILLYGGTHIIGAGRLEYVNAPGRAEGSVISAGQANMTFFKANNATSPISRVVIENLACGTTDMGVTAFDFTWSLSNSPGATGHILRAITVEGASTGQQPFAMAAIMDGNDECVLEDWHIFTGDIQWQASFPKLINISMVPPLSSSNTGRMILNGTQVLVRDSTVSNITFSNSPNTSIYMTTLDNVYMVNNNSHIGNITCSFPSSGQVGINCLRLVGCFMGTYKNDFSIFCKPGTSSGQNFSICRLVVEGCRFDTLTNSTGVVWVNSGNPGTALVAIAGNGTEMAWRDNMVVGTFGTGIPLYGSFTFQPRPAGLGLKPQPPQPSTSGLTTTNNYGCAVEVYIYGGTGSSPYVSINGTQVAGTLQGRFRLEPEDSITIYFSSAPTWIWYGN